MLPAIKQNASFLPILLGTDANAYGMARSFHEAYGIQSLSLGKIPLLETRHSRIVRVHTVDQFDQDPVFLSTLEEVAAHYGKDYEHLIIIACGDRYVELVTRYRNELEKSFIVPYIDESLKLKLEDKEDFYKICDLYGLDYPATVFLHPEDTLPDELPFGFPVAVKASDSISYEALDFPGKKKGYKAKSREELEHIVKIMREGNYQKTIIIQDFIPGDDAAMFVLNSYSNGDGKVQAMCLGQCALEDYTPHGIGNYNAIIQKGNPEIYETYQNFLEAISFIGFSNFDMKYDERDGRYKVFEINIRQGRSSFFTTASGCNLATYLVDDRIHDKTRPTPHLHNHPYLWLHVPKELLLDYAPERVLPEIRRLINTKAYTNTLLYQPDKTLYRRIMIPRFYHQAYKKFQQYWEKPASESH